MRNFAIQYKKQHLRDQLINNEHLFDRHCYTLPDMELKTLPVID